MNEPSSHQTHAISAIHLHSILFCRLPDVTHKSDCACTCSCARVCMCLWCGIWFQIKSTGKHPFPPCTFQLDSFFYHANTFSSVFHTLIIFTLILFHYISPIQVRRVIYQFLRLRLQLMSTNFFFRVHRHSIQWNDINAINFIDALSTIRDIKPSNQLKSIEF